MAICGFCKREVSIDDFYDGTKPKKWIMRKRWYKMFIVSCPHCQAILSIGFS